MPEGKEMKEGTQIRCEGRKKDGRTEGRNDGRKDGKKLYDARK
jgi:hypothetical protein